MLLAVSIEELPNNKKHLSQVLIHKWRALIVEMIQSVKRAIESKQMKEIQDMRSGSKSRGSQMDLLSSNNQSKGEESAQTITITRTLYLYNL